MYFRPIDRMWERVGNARDDSDTALFLELMNMGELLAKTVVAGMVAALEDTNRAQYSQLYSLVRAPGLGDWNRSLDEVLVGPSSSNLLPDAQSEKVELMQGCGPGTWQYTAVEALHGCLAIIDPTCDPISKKVAARQWIALFVQLRNKSRGHGALSSQAYSQACLPLEKSIRHFTSGFSLFRRPWAFLHRNLSGKYRVTKISEDTEAFNPLTNRFGATELATFSDGIYVHFGRPVKVELVQSDVDCLDFYYANGGSSSKHFEMLSYITGTRIEADIAPFMIPPTERPPSETQGVGALEVQGECFGNLPPMPQGYITRQSLESDLRKVLLDDHHPVVTLKGRGGIGKTSLTLKVLHELTHNQRFRILLWFSARDIDLLPQGPKLVKPHVRSEKDVARELVQLLAPTGIQPSKPEATAFFASILTKSPYEGMPILFVFDNFETVLAPQDLYAWIDHHVRTPNKVLITTRSGDFTGDFAVEVRGMNEDECEQLIDMAIQQLDIDVPIPESYRHDLIHESEGHPYVIKVLLGEVKKTGHTQKVERIVASREGMLDALFERTFNGLAPVTQRVFLTLCNWRSEVPQVAVEAVLLRPQNERMDVDRAVEQLWQSSFIEVTRPRGAETASLTVPLVAWIFGKRKLAVSPWRSAIEADTELLRSLGAAQRPNVKQGIGPRIRSMFQAFALRVGRGENTLAEYLPIMEFIARNYPPAWLFLADLYEEEGDAENSERAKDAIKHYLEEPESGIMRQQVWQRLASLCRRTKDSFGEIHALGELCLVPDAPLWAISNTVNDLNRFHFDTDEKRLIARQVAETMAKRIDELGAEYGATDCSRLAWLYLHAQDRANARRITERGLAKDPQNDYCLRLVATLGRT